MSKEDDKLVEFANTYHQRVHRLKEINEERKIYGEEQRSEQEISSIAFKNAQEIMKNQQRVESLPLNHEQAEKLNRIAEIEKPKTIKEKIFERIGIEKIREINEENRERQRFVERNSGITRAREKGFED